MKLKKTTNINKRDIPDINFRIQIDNKHIEKVHPFLIHLYGETKKKQNKNKENSYLDYLFITQQKFIRKQTTNR